MDYADLDAHAAVTAVWKAESPRLVGSLLRTTRDLDLAEDLAHDALVAALEQWPAHGVPANPGAWLTQVARRRAIDHFRRAQVRVRVEDRLGRDLAEEETAVPDFAAALDHVEDDVLRLMLVSCHPALTPESQVALTLRLLGGLSSKEIARAFMVPEPTVVRRITRAKRALGEQLDPYEVPDGQERARRLPAVLHVIYLIFTEGYAATAGDHWMRSALCDEALRLGRLVVDMFPADAEAHGLLALMELQASRADARVDDDGDPVLLADQDRTAWDQAAIRRGLESLGRALTLPGPGAYSVQAAIAATHARSASMEATDWPRIAGLYDTLAGMTPNPAVRLNRAVAHGMADGPAVGLALVDELVDEPALRENHLLPSVRGDLLAKLERGAEARLEFERAAALARNERERALLLRRAAELA
ncbi:RNA polymerase sigma factor [Spongisporangium articulatum]|uniref:RNA polymerase sigma factor n=1 Tax=Spongisporangium articulatum TaxID=3362603 RepID=A0ABW8AMN4_9ACTN